MRILLISHFFPPRHNAGTENYTLGLAKSLQLREIDVHVVCAEDWEFGNSYWNGVTEENYQGVPVTYIHLNWSKAHDPNRVLYYSEKVKNWFSQLLDDAPFDIVHIISASSLGVGIMDSVKDANIPLVLTLMDFWFLCPSVQLLRSNGELCDGVTTALECQSCLMLYSGVSERLAKHKISVEAQTRLWGVWAQLPILSRQRGFRGRLLNMRERKELLERAIELPDLVLTHSEVVREKFALHTERRIEVLRNGHELSWMEFYKGKTPCEKLRVGYVGQIIPIKGVHILIEAFKKANLKGRAKLEIWGGFEKDPAYVNQLEELVDGNASISFNGRFAHDDIANVFSNIDVLVVPSLWYENAPLVIQEAFTAETPVIATNLGGMAEMVSNEMNGLLFERGNTDDLARQLQRLINEPGLLERIKAGIPVVKTIEEEVDELERMYLELVENGKIKQ